MVCFVDPMNYDPILAQFPKPFHYVVDDKLIAGKQEVKSIPVCVVRVCEFPACWHQYSVWKDTKTDLDMLRAIHLLICPMRVLDGKGSMLSDRRWKEVSGSKATGDLYSHLKYGFLDKMVAGQHPYKFKESRFAASSEYEEARKFMNQCQR